MLFRSSTITEIKVNQNAYAYSMDDCTVGGVANYVTTFTQCTAASGTVVMTQPIQAQSFPISQSDITGWENDAAAGGTQASYTIDNNNSASLGPKRITGDITLGNGATLTLTGNVWVNGTINRSEERRVGKECRL